MLKDIRHGVRVMLQARGWTAVVVLTLAVGIGANAAIFTAVDGMLLQKLAVRDPDSVVRIRWAGPNDMAADTNDYGISAAGPSGERIGATFSYPMLQHLKSANQTLSDLAGSRPTGVTATIDGHAETASALLATGNYHELLGVTAQLGRTMMADDDRPTAPAVATLSDRYWRTRFGADPGVIGKTIRINRIPVTIVGVTSSAFTGTQRVTAPLHDFTMPLRLDDQISGDQPRMNDAANWWVQITGRLKQGMTPAQVEGNLGSVFQGQARAGMDTYLASSPDRGGSDIRKRTAIPRLLVDSGSRGTYDSDERQVRSLSLLSTVVALVLLLVCANVANLLLARASARQKEISIRLSIGATRGRLIRQLLTESLLLATAGGTTGILVARWGQALLPPPVGTTAPADVRIVLFTSAITALAGFVFGIAPALRATKMDVGASLKENSRSVAASNTALSRALLVSQVAISMVLLVGAGLFLRTLDNLRRVDIGFDPHNLIFVRVDAEGSGLSDERRFQYLEDGMARLKAIRGVRDATVSRPTLMTGARSGTVLFVQGRVYTPGRGNVSDYEINRVIVAPNYFSTLGIPLVSGRVFTDRDRQNAPEVAVINEAAARKFFPNENPIGRRFGHRPNGGNIEIVGMVRDVRYNNLREPPPPTLYQPHLQNNPEDLVFSIRTAGDPASVLSAARAAVSAADPDIPIVRVETQMATLEQRYAQEKVLAQAYTLFGGIAVFVAAIGLFGLMSYNVSRRTREIGIRMAMGAQRREVLSLVLRESLWLVGAGIAIGIAGALGAGRFVASQLFGIEPADPMTMAVAMIVMLAVSVAAGYLPARRATRVDPIVALRYE